MNTLKTNKGITLVALIITIIVLLILTVVAISSITDQGLFTKSQEAVNSYEDSRKEEEGKLAGYSSEINKYLQKDKIYSGYGVRFIISSDNKLTAYEEGVKVFENLQLVEISTPEDTVNPENYSKFYKISLGEDEEVIIAVSKDEKIIYFGDMAFELEEIYETPIVYRGIEANFNMEITTIVLSNTEAISHVKQGENSVVYKLSIVPYSQITSNYTKIFNEYGKEYSKAYVEENGQVDFVYCLADDVLLMTGTSNSMFTITNTKLELTNISKDEINAIIQKAN